MQYEHDAGGSRKLGWADSEEGRSIRVGVLAESNVQKQPDAKQNFSTCNVRARFVRAKKPGRADLHPT